MNNKKFLNIKVGVEFYETLMSKPSFQKNWKAISPSFYFVKRIAELNTRCNGTAVEFYSCTIASIFRHYTNNDYAEFLHGMESLGIIEISHDYKPTINKSGHCKKYLVTDYGCRLIHSANMQYLKRLKYDSTVRRRNQKNISSRKVMSKSYEHPVLNYVYDGLKNITFDYDEVDHAIKKSNWSPPQKAQVSNLLNSFSTKTFKNLEFHAVDGRIHYEWVHLKSDSRFLFRYNGIPYNAVLDVRCCHPTFFSSYILYNTHTPTPPTTPTTHTHPLLHYVYDDLDKASLLEQEHKKWVDIFCDPNIDPKEFIRKACGFEDIETAKAAMNQSLNGSRQFPNYLKWLKKEFPTLFELWQKTDVKDTGNAIARKYEHQLILHEELYAHAKSLGIVKIMPEHDGVGVFASDDDHALPSKLESLAKYLQNYSINQFGVPIIIKTKMVFDWANTDLLMEMEHKRGQMEKEYSKFKPEVSRLQRNYFSNGRQRKDGERLAKGLKKEHGILLRNKDVLEYWMERERKGLS